MPTSTSLASVIGTPLMWYVRIRSSASETSASGGSVTGSTIIPDSLRFTLSTSATWSSIERFRWMIPMPPSRASAIARRASVTVSIAAETSGISSVIDAREPRRGRNVVRKDARLGGNEQHVVERQPFLGELLLERKELLELLRTELDGHERSYHRPPTALDAALTGSTARTVTFATSRDTSR